MHTSLIKGFYKRAASMQITLSLRLNVRLSRLLPLRAAMGFSKLIEWSFINITTKDKILLNGGFKNILLEYCTKNKNLKYWSFVPFSEM